MRILADGPPPYLPGFLNTLVGPLDHFGYWAVLLFVMIEDFGIPVPGETILIAAPAYAGAGRLNVLAIGVIGFVAAVIGDNIGFAIGHYGGRTLVLLWGRYVRLTGERLDKAEIFFNSHGAWIITVARFIEVLRQANGIWAFRTPSTGHRPWPGPRLAATSRSRVQPSSDPSHGLDSRGVASSTLQVTS